MPLTVSHALSATTPDNPAYEIQMKHWNSSHLFTLNASGSEISGAFSNAVGGVTFGLETNGYITGSAPAAAGGLTNINVSAGTTSNNLSAFQFSNANGVSFGLNGSTVTATVKTDYLTSQSNQAFSAGGGSSAFQTLSFSDGNGVTFTNTNGQLGASVATSYRASNDAIGLNTAFTAGPLAWTVNSSGISLNASSAAGTTSGFAGNQISGSMTHNTAGLNLSLNHPAWISTAAQTSQTLALGISNTGNTAGNTGTSIGIPFVIAGSNNITASQSTAAGQNTLWISGPTLSQYFSNTGTTLNGTNLGMSATLNTNGLRLDINNTDDHVKGFGLTGNTAGTTGSTYTTTNVQFFSGGPNITLSGNSNTIVISGAPAGGTTFYTGSYFANMNWPGATTTMTFSGSTLHMASFSIQQNMSIDFLRVLVTGSVLAASSTAATTGNTSYGGGSTKSHNLVLYTRGAGANSMSLQSYGSTQRVENAAWTISAAANSTQFSYSLRYTLNSNSTTTGFTKDYSSSVASLNFHSSQLTDLTGLKQYEIPFATALTPGQYWLGYQVLTSVSTARTADESRWGLAYSSYGVTAPQLSFGVLGAASNSHYGLMPMVGSITTNATTTTASFPMTNITSSSNNAVLFFQGMRIT